MPARSIDAAQVAYRGRFAPSPTGPLHAGSLVAALASWLDARAHRGTWLVRIEDVDTPRCSAEAARTILAQLAACGLQGDETPCWQSTRGAAYQRALQGLVDRGLAYPCGCTRSEIEAWWTARGVPHEPGAERIYPGLCRDGLKGKPARAWRLRAEGRIDWWDRRLGAQSQDLSNEVGDFVLRRADDLWAYQLAVVVDDAEQGISHVVRGEDLADNTARQIALQRALGLPTPSYLHTPLVLAADGRKLSKQNGAQALSVAQPVHALQQAAAHLGLPPIDAAQPADWLAQAVPLWAGIIASFSARR
jgi:glutamyl-Q tRNA(Asp) synthetase